MPKKIVPFKDITKPAINWREEMSREQKAFRNKWKTEKKPYTPTPKTKDIPAPAVQANS